MHIYFHWEKSNTIKLPLNIDSYRKFLNVSWKRYDDYENTDVYVWLPFNKLIHITICW